MAKQKWLIEWNASGMSGQEEYDMVEAENREEAVMIAYENAREAFESSADYGAEPMTAELAEEHGFEFTEDESANETMTAPTVPQPSTEA